jgi:beta-hydroxyacyl-ACP dehydratase FabZ
MSPAQTKDVFDIQAILKRLPHRYPFLLVDRVLEMQLGERLVAVKNVSINEPFFQGHFPGEPVMPGVLIVEALAQAGGILVAETRGEAQGSIVFLASIRKARFRRPVRPGDQLRLEIVAQSAKSMAPRVDGKAWVGEQLAAEAEIMFAFAKTGE